jgi:hypothetical protein
MSDRFDGGISALQNENIRLRGYAEGLLGRIQQHNRDLAEQCAARKCHFKEYDLRCPECPKDYELELTDADLAPPSNVIPTGTKPDCARCGNDITKCDNGPALAGRPACAGRFRESSPEIWRSEGERLLAEHEAATRASKLTPDEKLLEAEDDATGELSTWLWENRAKLIGSRLQRWASSWRPASEPPPLHKHGCSEWILATDGTRYMAERFYRHAGPDAGTWGGDSRGYLWEVTHWMPRPPFPESLRT